MGISMAGGPFSYNRFDDYEKAVNEASKPDYLDFDKDGDKEEPMKKALKEKGGKKEDEKEDKKSDDKESADESTNMMNMYVAALGRMGSTFVPLGEAEKVKQAKKYGEKTMEKGLDKGADTKLDEEKVKQAKKMSEKELEKGLDKGADTHKEAFMAGYEAAMNEAAGAGSPGKMAASVKKEADSNKKETDAMAFASKKQRRQQAVNAAEEFVMNKLMEDGLANNQVSADARITRENAVLWAFSALWKQSSTKACASALPVGSNQKRTVAGIATGLQP